MDGKKKTSTKKLNREQRRAEAKLAKGTLRHAWRKMKSGAHPLEGTLVRSGGTGYRIDKHGALVRITEKGALPTAPRAAHPTEETP